MVVGLDWVGWVRFEGHALFAMPIYTYMSNKNLSFPILILKLPNVNRPLLWILYITPIMS